MKGIPVSTWPFEAMNQLALVADERHVEARSLRLKNVVSSTEVSHECLESAWIQSASLVYMDLRAMGIDMGLTLTNTIFPSVFVWLQR